MSRATSDEAVTARVVQQFITAFQTRDPSLIPEIVGETCVMEGMQPEPDGLRVEGHADNVRFWQAMVSDSSGTFEQEELVIWGDRAVNRWRYRFGEGNGSSIRGVTLIRVEKGKIVEALGYAKRPPPDLGTWGEREEHSVRGVNPLRVTGGQIAETLGDVKGGKP